MPKDDTFLSVTVGPFILALAAQNVIEVCQDVAMATFLSRPEGDAPLLDLSELLLGERRVALPFVAVVESDAHTAAFGVDKVGHLHRGDAHVFSHIPPLGLLWPELFSFAMRHDDGLLFVLDPAALIARAFSF